MELQKLYINLSQASSLIPIITGILYFKSLTRSFKILFYFFVVSVIAEIQAIIAIELFHNNMPGLHVFTLIEFLAFSTLYYLNIQKNSIVRYMIMINALIFFFVAVADALWINGIMALNSLSRGYSSGFMILYSLGYLYYLFKIDDTRYLREYPMFWVCTGALIYFAVNSPYFMMKSSLMNEAMGLEWASHLTHAALNIIANLLYAQSFRCLGKQKTV